MNHTKTPWIVRMLPGGETFVEGPRLPGMAYGLDICGDDYTGYGEAEARNANMRLISASPDLLEACKEFVRKVDCGEARSVRSYARMKAAIAKAEE